MLVKYLLGDKIIKELTKLSNNKCVISIPISEFISIYKSYKTVKAIRFDKLLYSFDVISDLNVNRDTHKSDTINIYNSCDITDSIFIYNESLIINYNTTQKHDILTHLSSAIKHYVFQPIISIDKYDEIKPQLDNIRKYVKPDCYIILFLQHDNCLLVNSNSVLVFDIDKIKQIKYIKDLSKDVVFYCKLSNSHRIDIIDCVIISNITKYDRQRTSSINKSKYAYSVLVMINDNYIAGALALAFSLYRTNTQYAVTCMITPDISKTGKKILEEVFDEVYVVDYVSIKCKPMKTQKQQEFYGTWIDKSFTKWQILTLDKYDKVMLLDADIVALENMDSLFELQTPASCFSYPWAKPAQYKGLDNLYNDYYMNKYKRPIETGDTVSADILMRALKHPQGTFVEYAALTILTPSKRDFADFIKVISGLEPFGFTTCVSGFDEQSITYYYANRGVNWTHIHQQYLMIPWHYKTWGDRQPIYGVHYFNPKKPWDMIDDDWKDILIFWNIVKAMSCVFPIVKSIYKKKLDDNLYNLDKNYLVNNYVISMLISAIDNKNIRYQSFDIDDHVLYAV